MTNVYDVQVEHVDPKQPAFTEHSVYSPVIADGVLTFVRPDGVAVLISTVASEIERVLTRPVEGANPTAEQLDHPFYYDTAPSKKYVPSQTLEGMASDAEQSGVTWDVRTWNADPKRAGSEFLGCKALMVQDGMIGLYRGDESEWPLVTLNLYAGIARAEITRNQPEQE